MNRRALAPVVFLSPPTAYRPLPTLHCLLLAGLLSAPRALGGEVPSAAEVFARLRERAQRLNGLRCTLELQSPDPISSRYYEAEWGLPRRWLLEFRAPGHLRLESLPGDELPWTKAVFKPEIAVVTPSEQWRFLPWRDELILGQPDSAGARGDARGWEAYPRAFAALLAPDALYREHDIRRVFPDVVRGHRCYLMLLAKEGLPTDYLWIDPERWTILRLCRVRHDLRGPGDLDHAAVVAEHEEVAPGAWLPRVVHQAWREPVAIRATDFKPGYTPALERFVAPKHDPLLLRSASMRNALEVMRPVEGPPGAMVSHPLHECYVDPAQRESVDEVAHLKSFVARNPRIRGGYYDLARSLDDYAEGMRVIEEASKRWPDDLALRVKVLSYRYHKDPSRENAAALAPYAWPHFGLMDRLDRQVRAGEHAAARLSARELLDEIANSKALDNWVFSNVPFGKVLNAARNGGWLNELRADCERRAAADPPSELHLRLLVRIVGEEEKTRDRLVPLLRRLADLRRDSPEVQLECSGRHTLDILSRLLDSLPADDFLHRQAALSRLRSTRDTVMIHEGHPDPVREFLEADLEQRRDTLSRDQRLWRYRELAACYDRDPPRAIACLRQAIELAREDETLRLRLLAHLVKNGERAEALEVFHRLLADHPGRPELWTAWRPQLNIRENPEFAQRVLQGLLACAPTNESTYECGERVCSELGRFAEAAQWALKRGAGAVAAKHLMRAKDAPGALAIWLDEVRRARRRPALHAQMKAGYVNGVVRTLADPKSAAELDPAWLAGQWLPALTTALQRLPHTASAEDRAALCFALGSACRALRQHAKAAQHYARGLKLLPKFDEGRKWLNEIAPNYPLDDF
ncbi:MAG: hypothetical protein FJ290_04420 [Planctomycetes bacterium]|nr:hypothetical protein [Planctomycetota bacterium]